MVSNDALRTAGLTSEVCKQGSIEYEDSNFNRFEPNYVSPYENNRLDYSSEPLQEDFSPEAPARVSIATPKGWDAGYFETERVTHPTSLNGETDYVDQYRTGSDRISVEIEPGQEEKSVNPDKDEKNLHHCLKNFSRVPYLKANIGIGLKTYMNEGNGDIRIASNIGLNMDFILQNGKMKVSPPYVGLHTDFNALKEFETVTHHTVDFVDTGTFDFGMELKDHGVALKNNLSNDYSLDVGYNHILRPSLKPNEEVQIVSPKQELDFGVLHITAESGVNRSALYEAMRFLDENNESIKKGLGKVTVKTAKELHSKTGNVLKKFIDMPYIID